MSRASAEDGSLSPAASPGGLRATKPPSETLFRGRRLRVARAERTIEWRFRSPAGLAVLPILLVFFGFGLWLAIACLRRAVATGPDLAAGVVFAIFIIPYLVVSGAACCLVLPLRVRLQLGERVEYRRGPLPGRQVPWGRLEGVEFGVERGSSFDTGSVSLRFREGRPRRLLIWWAVGGSREEAVAEARSVASLLAEATGLPTRERP